MLIHLIAATNRQPDWVDAACQNYANRFHGQFKIQLSNVRLAQRRGQVDIAKAKIDEATRLLAAVPMGAHVVALDESGAAWSSRKLAERLKTWRDEARQPAFLIGGPDGLDAACLASADEKFSLSALTLPHGLAKVVVLEALYRATTIVSGHPYHRD